MYVVDEFMDAEEIEGHEYSDDEYETAVNNMAPVLVMKLNCNDFPDVCNKQNIRAYPTMRVFVDGQAKGDYTGHRTVMEIFHWLSHIEAEHREPGELKMHMVEECKRLTGS